MYHAEQILLEFSFLRILNVQKFYKKKKKREKKKEYFGHLDLFSKLFFKENSTKNAKWLTGKGLGNSKQFRAYDHTYYMYIVFQKGSAETFSFVSDLSVSLQLWFRCFTLTSVILQTCATVMRINMHIVQKGYENKTK